MKKQKGQRRFFYHYNKPASLAEGRNILTVHWKGRCYLVADIRCYVPTETRHRKSQPRCVIQGWAHHLHLVQRGDGIWHFQQKPYGLVGGMAVIK